MYGRGNPVSNNDPTGHVACAANDSNCYNAHGLFDNNSDGTFDDHGLADFSNVGISDQLFNDMLREAGIVFENALLLPWTEHEMKLVMQGVVAYANYLSNWNNVEGLTMVNRALGDRTTSFMKVFNLGFNAAQVGRGNGATEADTASGLNNNVYFNPSAFGNPNMTPAITVHELTHVMDYNATPFRSLSNNSAFIVGDLGTYVRQVAMSPFSWVRNDLTLESYAEAMTFRVFSSPAYPVEFYRDARGADPIQGVP